ncbi:MAG: hypothetical protein PVJ92_03460 [Candidatus Dependentiae bacterium]|jgi:hypothetical protein
MTGMRLSLLLCIIIAPLQLQSATVVYPAAQTCAKQHKHTKRHNHTRTTLKPAWAMIPENIIIRGDNDPSPLMQSRLPQEDYEIGFAAEEEEEEEEEVSDSALFTSRHAPVAPPIPPSENGDEQMVELSFDNTDELLSSLGEVFQIDEETMNEIQNFDFSALADMDFGEEEVFDEGNMPSESLSLDSFKQFDDFSSLFAQE